MNTQELRRRLYNVEKIGYGTYKITVERRRIKRWVPGYGVVLDYTYRSHITHNSQAVDRINSYGELPDRVVSHGYTYAQALRALIRP
jgi:hypothetical protein